MKETFDFGKVDILPPAEPDEVGNALRKAVQEGNITIAEAQECMDAYIAALNKDQL